MKVSRKNPGTGNERALHAGAARGPDENPALPPEGTELLSRKITVDCGRFHSSDFLHPLRKPQARGLHSRMPVDASVAIRRGTLSRVDHP